MGNNIVSKGVQNILDFPDMDLFEYLGIHYKRPDQKLDLGTG